MGFAVATRAFLVGFWLLGEPVSTLRFIAAALIIVGVILMKIATPD
jgi:multidrug transporter EmrE-like cation transporter